MAKVEMTRKVDFKAKGIGARDGIRVALGQALSDETARMIQRIRRGDDVDGRAMEALSPEYAAFKEKKGRKPMPDMTFSGRMLASISHKINNIQSGVEGVVSFFNAKEALKARGNLRHRKFFGFSKEQIARIRERIRNQNGRR